LPFQEMRMRRSLSTVPRRERTRLAGNQWTRRAQSAVRGVLEREWHLLGGIACVLVAGLWAPSLAVVSWLPSRDLVNRYLPIIWQVQAAAVGLSLAIIVFSFQAFSQSRHAASLREFASQSLAMPIVLFGLVSLVVDGLALLGLGRDAPGGWAGLWAVSLSLASLALLPVLTIALLRGLEPRRLHVNRLARLRQLIDQTVDLDLLERIALVELAERCSARGWEFLPIFGASGRSGWTSVTTSRPGRVIDVRERVMDDLTPMCPTSKPVLLTRVGRTVEAATPVLLLPPDAVPEALPTADRLVRVTARAEHSPPLLDAVRLLHQQARQAIRDANPLWLDEIGEAYEELLTALPRAWLRYGISVYHQGVAQSVDAIARSPVDHIARQMFQEMEAAAASTDSEMTQRAFSTPYSVLIMSSGLRAEALSRAMLQLLVHGFRIGAESPDPSVSDLTTDTVAQYLLEFASLTLYQLKSATIFDSDAEAAVRHLEMVFDSLADVLRAALDAGHASDVTDIHHAWRRDIDLWLESGQTNEANKALRELGQRESELRVALASWAIGERIDRTVGQRTVEYFAEMFGTIEAVMEATVASIRRSSSADMWLDWVPPPRFGGTYSPAMDLDLLRGGLVLCLVLISAGQPIRLGDTAWLPSRLDAARQFLESMSYEEWNWLFEDKASLTQSLAALSTALDQAVSRQKEAEASAVLAAPIDTSRVDALKTETRQAWDRLSLVERLFSQMSKVEALDSKPGSRESDALKVTVNIQRSMVVASDIGVDFGILGQDVARELARQDLDRLASATGAAAQIWTKAPDLRGRLNEALARVAATSQVLAILAPRNLYIDMALGLLTSSGSAKGESVFGDSGVGHWYRGSIDGVPLVHSRAIAKDRIVVVGAAWGTYVKWDVGPSEELEFVVREHEAPPRNLAFTTRRWAWIEGGNAEATCGFRIDDLDLSFSAINT